MKQRENVVLRAAFCGLAHRRIQILDPRKWNKLYPPPFRHDDQAIRGVAWRQNTGGFKFGRQLVRFGIRGSPDIVGMLRGGQFFGLECKDRSETSAYQDWYHGFFGGLGMLIAVVRSYEDTIKTLDRWGIS